LIDAVLTQIVALYRRHRHNLRLLGGELISDLHDAPRLRHCVSGYAKQSEFIRAFGVTSISVKRSVKLYREKGARGFYAPRVTRGAAVAG
jgi:hypothetical protein